MARTASALWPRAHAAHAFRNVHLVWPSATVCEMQTHTADRPPCRRDEGGAHRTHPAVSASCVVRRGRGLRCRLGGDGELAYSWGTKGRVAGPGGVGWRGRVAVRGAKPHAARRASTLNRVTLTVARGASPAATKRDCCASASSRSKASDVHSSPGGAGASTTAVVKGTPAPLSTTAGRVGWRRPASCGQRASTVARLDLRVGVSTASYLHTNDYKTMAREHKMCAANVRRGC